MSMQVYGAIQLIAILCSYFALIMALPSLMFARRLRGRGLCQRFLFCFVAGNFYIITVVCALGLVGITSRLALYIVLFGGALYRYFITTDKDYAGLLRTQGRLLVLLFKRSLGVRSYLSRQRSALSKVCSGIMSPVLKHLRRHCIEWVIFAFITAFNIWYFSYQTMHYYGYGASDTTVHLNWVELMASGRMFAAGVYPHGFHCIIYAMYRIFGFRLFVLMRFFGAVQSTFIVMMIYAYARRLCRNKYSAFIAYAAFSLCQIFHIDTMMRFQMTLPQEYGMLFLFPMLIYLSEFIRAGEKEARRVKSGEKAGFRAKCKKRRDYLLNKAKILFTRRGQGAFFERRSTFYLTMAAVSLSLTLSVHFYITICACVMCAAFAIAYITKVPRRKYFLRLVCALIAALTVSTAPMALALAGGRELEGSLRWALSIIRIGSEATENITKQESEGTEIGTEDDGVDNLQLQTSEQEEKPRPAGVGAIIRECYDSFVPSVMSRSWFILTLSCLVFVLIHSVIRAVSRRSLRSYERITLCLYLILMFFLFNASTLGIPELMDKIRARVLIAYAIPVLYSCVFDRGCELFVALLAGSWRVGYRLVNGTAALMCAMCICTIFLGGGVKHHSYFYMLQHNGAVTCLYDIVHKYPTDKWTIVSVVDETRMVWGEGFHYETIDFLFNLENWNSSKTLYLPTQYVFFYIEKRVLDYSALQKADRPLPDTLLTVSEEYARQDFPEYTSKSRYYRQTDRAVVMSKMYYWAQEYKKLFPDELRVYYEDEYFICYKLEQNEYHLNNFAINYGYNVD